MGDFRLWAFAADMNGDGAVTVSDLWLWAKWLYFYPGDLFFYGLMSGPKALASFFELSPANYGGIVSGALSLFVWLIVWAFSAVALDDLRTHGLVPK